MGENLVTASRLGSWNATRTWRLAEADRQLWITRGAPPAGRSSALGAVVELRDDPKQVERPKARFTIRLPRRVSRASAAPGPLMVSGYLGVAEPVHESGTHCPGKISVTLSFSPRTSTIQSWPTAGRPPRRDGGQLTDIANRHRI